MICGSDDMWDIIVTFEIDESWDSPHEPFVLGGKVCQHQTTLISSCYLDYYGETNIIEVHGTNSVNLQRDVIETSAVTIRCILGIPNWSHLIIAIGGLTGFLGRLKIMVSLVWRKWRQFLTKWRRNEDWRFL